MINVKIMCCNGSTTFSVTIVILHVDMIIIVKSVMYHMHDGLSHYKFDADVDNS